MSRRIAMWVACWLWLLTLGLAILGFMLAFRNAAARPDMYELPVHEVTISIIFATLGAFIAFFRPRNRIGWVYCAEGFLAGLLVASGHYGEYAIVTALGSLPAPTVAAWINGWVWAPALVLAGTFCLLLFPDGRLPSPRWRPVAWLATAALVFTTSVAAVLPWPPPSSIENPLRVDEVGGVSTATMLNIGGVLLFSSVLASLLSLFVCFRRAKDTERQQLKWVAYAALIGILLYFAAPYVRDVISYDLMLVIAFSLFTAAIALAILKYRLYDIDIIINRTLVYGVLTTLLALVYVANVIALQSVFRTLTGQGDQLAIVASTLVIAALFNPLRHRIQDFIDRRFYRRKYDAQKTLQAFSVRLRDEVELERLTDDLLAVVQETLQPAHVSLWLWEPAKGAKQ